MSDDFSLGGSASASFSGSGSLQVGTGPASTNDLIKDTTTETFMADVIEASRSQPVLVDFWAPWCGPCKQLTPFIEAAVKKAAGKVRLVKMNIDDHPAVAGQMGIQSIPAVVAFKDGQPADGFMGALPESEITAFIEKIAGPTGPSPAAATLEAAEAALAEDNFGDAAQGFAAVLQAEPGNVQAMAGMAMCYIGTDQTDKATELLDMVRERLPEALDNPAMKAVQVKLELLAQAKDLGEAQDLLDKVAALPDDHQARFDLAVALNGRGDKAGAVDALLHIINYARDWNDDAARTQLLQFFESWGAKDPETKAGRRKLSALLFS